MPAFPTFQRPGSIRPEPSLRVTRHVFLLSVLLSGLWLCAPHALPVETVSPLENEEKYTENFNKQIEAQHQSKIAAGRRQGRIENILYVLLLAVLFTPLIHSFVRRGAAGSRSIAFLAAFPNVVNLSFLLVFNSAGEWGSLKHPVLHRLVENHKEQLPDIFVLSMLACMTAYVLIVGFDFRRTGSIRGSVAVNLVVYVLGIAAIFGLTSVLSRLVSQGAGQ